MEKIIRLEKISFSYNRPKEFIKDLSLTIDKGSYVCLLGSNGSGKSTLVKLISGLLSSNKGDIYIDGILLNKENINKIRDYICILFQNPDNQFVESTLEDDIIFGLENHNKSREEITDALIKVSKVCHIQDLLNRDPSSLSGGEKQKGNLASVLALNPKILILDEAYSMLDPSSKKEVKELIKKIQLETNMTIISITHDGEEILNCDRVIVLDDGDIVFDGDKEEFYNFDSNSYGISSPKIMQLEKELGLKEFIDEEDLKVGVKL